MKMIPWGVVVLIFLLCGGPVFADEMPSPGDFAFGFQVEADGEAALYEAALPLAFYQGVTAQDLSDVCMFNSEGELVPFALRRPDVKSSARAETAPLPLFPIRGETDRKLEGLSLQIRRDDSGAIIDVNTGEPQAPDRGIVAYLVDATGVRRPMTALELEWQPTSESFVGKVSVESSNDLNSWTVVVRDATIAGLRYGDHSLIQRRIRLNGGTSARYLRLSWPQSRENVALTTVLAELRTDAPDQPIEWVTLDAAAGADSSREYRFDARGPLPVNRVRVDLPRTNSLVAVSVLSRNSDKDQWRPRHTGLVYRLNVKGEEILSPDAPLPSTATDRYWLLRVDVAGAGLGQGMPRLQLGWTPHKIVFIPQGRGPFRLAYGNARVDRQRLQMDDALRRFVSEHKSRMEVAPARLGPSMILGGESRLRPAVAYPWKQWGLWAVLVLGVALMTWMSVRLYKQMGKENKEQGP